MNRHSLLVQTVALFLTVGFAAAQTSSAVIGKKQSNKGDARVALADGTTITTDLSPSIPKTYVGFRVLPVPAALAAHIGDEGLLIGNVMSNSPADDAGIQQFDVIRMFGNTRIDSLETLMDAIAKTGSTTSKAVIIRNGQPLTVTITPAKRSESPVVWKYAQPEDQILAQSVNCQSIGLKKLPNGSWTFQTPDNMPDLTAEVLRNLPEILKKSKQHGVEMRIFGEGKFGPGSCCETKRNITTDINNAPPKFLENMTFNCDSKINMISEISTEAGRLRVQQDGEGKYTVTKIDTDGNETTKTFASAEQFEQEMPEEYKRISATFEVGIMPILSQSQNPQDFEKVREYLQQHLPNGKSTIMTRKVCPTQTDQGTFDVAVRTDGTVVVTITKNGNAIRHEYTNLDAFEADSPAWYKKYKKLTE